MKCKYCNNDFNPPIREVNRGNGKFCSISCSSKYYGNLRKKIHSSNTICSLCGKSFYRMPGHKGNSKSGLFFCNRKCKDLAQRIGGIKEIQPNHYGTSLASYRDKGFRYLKHECNRCGWNKYPSILQVHHKDQNRNNNEIENLEMICPNCHAIEHWLSKK